MSNTYRAPQQRLGTYWFQIFKAISLQPLMDHQTNWTETSVSIYDKEYLLCRISSKKALKQNKNQLQQTAKTKNPGERENLIFRIAITYYLKYSVSNKKLWDMERNKKAWPSHRKKKRNQKLSLRKSRCWTY